MAHTSKTLNASIHVLQKNSPRVPIGQINELQTKRPHGILHILQREKMGKQKKLRNIQSRKISNLPTVAKTTYSFKKKKSSKTRKY